jgi:hypothetical protein
MVVVINSRIVGNPEKTSTQSQLLVADQRRAGFVCDYNDVERYQHRSQIFRRI